MGIKGYLALQDGIKLFNLNDRQESHEKALNQKLSALKSSNTNHYAT